MVAGRSRATSSRLLQSRPWPDWDRTGSRAIRRGEELPCGPREEPPPDAPRRGATIEGLDRITATTHPDVTVFHAGTQLIDGRIDVSGGRVLGVTALGDSLRQAQRAAYAAVNDIHFDGMQFRTDIGHRALKARP